MVLIVREYNALKALRRGEALDVEGVLVKMTEGVIQPGDFYVGERNTGPKLLIAKEIHEEWGIIYPEGIGYPFDIGECVRVEEAALNKEQKNA